MTENEVRSWSSRYVTAFPTAGKTSLVSKAIDLGRAPIDTDFMLSTRGLFREWIDHKLYQYKYEVSQNKGEITVGELTKMMSDWKDAMTGILISMAMIGKPFDNELLVITNLWGKRFVGYAPDHPGAANNLYFVRTDVNNVVDLWMERQKHHGNQDHDKDKVRDTVEGWISSLHKHKDHVPMIDLGNYFLGQVVDVDVYGKWRLNKDVNLTEKDGFLMVTGAPAVPERTTPESDKNVAYLEIAYKYWFNHVVGNVTDPALSYKKDKPKYLWAMGLDKKRRAHL